MTETETNVSSVIRFEPRENYLYVYVVKPQESVNAAITYWRTIIDECIARKYSKVLVEIESRYFPSTVDVYEMVNAVRKMLVINIMIAFVDGNIHRQQLNKFGEIVAQNRGIRGRVFKDQKDAEAWLSGANN